MNDRIPADTFLNAYGAVAGVCAIFLLGWCIGNGWSEVSLIILCTICGGTSVSLLMAGLAYRSGRNAAER